MEENTPSSFNLITAGSNEEFILGDPIYPRSESQNITNEMMASALALQKMSSEDLDASKICARDNLKNLFAAKDIKIESEFEDLLSQIKKEENDWDIGYLENMLDNDAKDKKNWNIQNEEHNVLHNLVRVANDPANQDIKPSLQECLPIPAIVSQMPTTSKAKCLESGVTDIAHDDSDDNIWDDSTDPLTKDDCPKSQTELSPPAVTQTRKSILETLLSTTEKCSRSEDDNDHQEQKKRKTRQKETVLNTIEICSESEDENDHQEQKKRKTRQKNKQSQVVKFSYKNLISMAILSTSEKHISTEEILKYISSHFPEVCKRKTNWDILITEHLNKSQYFLKHDAQNQITNWTLNPSTEKNLRMQLKAKADKIQLINIKPQAFQQLHYEDKYFSKFPSNNNFDYDQNIKYIKNSQTNVRGYIMQKKRKQGLSSLNCKNPNNNEYFQFRNIEKERDIELISDEYNLPRNVNSGQSSCKYETNVFLQLSPHQKYNDVTLIVDVEGKIKNKPIANLKKLTEEMNKSDITKNSTLGFNDNSSKNIQGLNSIIYRNSDYNEACLPVTQSQVSNKVLYNDSVSLSSNFVDKEPHSNDCIIDLAGYSDDSQDNSLSLNISSVISPTTNTSTFTTAATSNNSTVIIVVTPVGKYLPEICDKNNVTANLVKDKPLSELKNNSVRPNVKYNEETFNSEEHVLILSSYDYISSTNKYECRICKKIFNRKGKIIRHLESHSNYKSYACMICSKAYKNLHTLRYHIESAHTTFQIKCSLCDKTYQSNHLLKIHIRKYHMKKKVSTPKMCHICQKVLSSPARLLFHMQGKHGYDHEQYTCNECSATFYAKHLLVVHMKAKHLPPEYKCSKCPALFSTFAQQKSHLHNDHMVRKIQKFVCEYCGKKFENKEILSNHILIHTGEKPFSCEECGKCFRTITNLQQHSVTHSDKRPFSCDLCNKSFRIRNHLRQHMSVHGMVSTSSSRKKKR